MEIKITRADGVVVELDDWNADDSGRLFLSWDDVKKLELERKGYEVVKETAKQLRKKPKK